MRNEKPKFKVGEIVRIREWDDMEKEFGTTMSGSIKCHRYFSEGMKPLCGEYAKIVGLAKNCVEVTLKLFGCDKSVQSWHYSTDMIEKV